MAKGSGSGGGGGSDLPKGQLTFGKARALAEGFITGAGAALVPTLMRTAIEAYFRGKEPTAKATEDDVTALRTIFKTQVAASGNDPKVAEEAELSYHKLVRISTSAKPDAEKDKEQDQVIKDFRAFVDRQRLEQYTKSFEDVVSQLSVAQQDLFLSWLQHALTAEQRERIIARKKSIKKKMIEDVIVLCFKYMGVTEAEPAKAYDALYLRWRWAAMPLDRQAYDHLDERQRRLADAWAKTWSTTSRAMYDHLMIILPQPSAVDRFWGAVEDAITTRGGERARAWSASNVAHRRESAEMETRCFTNRRNV